MKKRIVLFLFLYCLVLSSCSTDNNANTSIPCEPMEQAAVREAAKNSTVSVLISVNPQIKIFLDASDNVTAIQCINDEAKAIFGGNGFAATQQDYPSLLLDILERMVAQGYLSDGGEIRFEIFGPTEDATAHYNTASRTVVQQLCEKEKITVAVSCGGGHTEYWIGNTMIGGIDSDGNVWGDTFATYSGPINGGTVGVG